MGSNAMDSEQAASPGPIDANERQAARRAAREAKGAGKIDVKERRVAVRKRNMRLKAGEVPEKLEPHTSTPEEQIKRLKLDAELLRTKVFQLHRALIAIGTLKSTTLGAPEGDVVPEEMLIGGHEQVMLAFGGMASRLQMPPAEFGRTFADRQADLIFYKDLQQCWYQRGLLGMTDDVPGTAEHIRRRVAEYGWKRIFTVGTSAGGYAAILFGALVGASRIVAFSPQTLVGPKVFRRFASTDSRQTDIDIKGRFLDLAKVLEETGFAGRIDLFYGTRNAMDVLAAEWLQRFPCVTLHPVDTASHNSAQKARDEGRFSEIFSFLD
jgi:hypothetical protein